jgi:hypothetical protein
VSTKIQKMANFKVTAFGLGLVGTASALTSCGDPQTISTTEALKLASSAYQCPPGLVVAFESKESNLGEIQKAAATTKKIFTDIDCSKPEGISLVSKVVDIKSWLPFIGTEVNNGVVLINGQAKAVKYKDPAGKFSFEPIRIKEDLELDKYFKGQEFQKQSGDASKNILGQKWDLYDTKGEDFVRKQYIKDGIVSEVKKETTKKKGK